MYAARSLEASPVSANALIDLRSDTVTRPSAAMRVAMAEADVGDDVYGDDPTVRALEEQVADLLGKEAALFVASGTQSNLAAVLSHCGRGDEYISGVGYHIPTYEGAGAAVLGGVSPRLVAPQADGGLGVNDVLAAVQPDDPHFAISRLVCLENTHNGRVVDQDNLEQVAQAARDKGLAVHLDGARLMNAVVQSKRAAKDLVACCDTVSLCLSKGLGAPVGSVLSGPADFINKARRNRKLLGGGLRQSGVLAACGLYALNNNVERLADDHENARALANGLAELDGVELDTASVETNMIWMKLAASQKAGHGLSAFMREHGIVVGDASGPDNKVRLVTHLDFDTSFVPRVVDAFAQWSAA